MQWLGRKEKGWVYWSSHDRETSVQAVRDAGLTVLLDEVSELDVPTPYKDGVMKDNKTSHLWVMAEKAA
jgi:hypothetical protein